MENIHPPPGKLTRQKDATELARIEAHAQVAGAEPPDSPPAMASNAGIGRNPAEPKEHSQAKTHEASPDGGRIRSVSPKTESAYREAKRHRRRYAQQGSFFDAISRALGL